MATLCYTLLLHLSALGVSTGGVTSCGQGSVWRVDALSGLKADGTCALNWRENLSKVGQDFGFDTQTLVEDTGTSIKLVRRCNNRP